MSIKKKKRTRGETKGFSLPLKWTMERLAECKEVDTDIVTGLLSKVSNEYDMTIAKEKLVLRRLEDLFTVNGKADSRKRKSASVVIDVAEPAQVVYNRLHKLMKTSRSRASIAESFKLDVRHFVFHKRACLPTCALFQKLEEALVEGDCSSIAFARGVSGLNRELQKKPATKIGELRPVNEITFPLVPENVIEIMEDLPLDDVIVSHKRKRSEYNLPQNAPLDGFHGRDHLVEAKRGSEKMAIASKKSSEKITSPSVQENLIVIMEDGPLNEVIVSHKRKRNEYNIPQNAPLDGFHEKDPLVEAKSLSEKMATASKKSNFMSSQMTLNQDTPELDWTEQKSCIKCDRGDQLLICCVSTCLLAVHETCLGSSAIFDNTGNFYCPFCSSKQETAAYHEKKEKYIRAKEKVELAKNRLDSFVNTEREHKQNQPSELPSMGELEQSKIAENLNFQLEIDANGKKKEMANNQAILAGACQQEAEAAYVCSKILHRGPHPSPSSSKYIFSITRETQQKHGNDHIYGRVAENQESLEPSSVQCSNIF